MKFNSVGKDHLSFSRKFRLKNGRDKSFISIPLHHQIAMNGESHCLEAEQTAGFCGRWKVMGEIQMLMGPLHSRRGSVGPFSLPACGGEGSGLQIWGWGHWTVNTENCSLPGLVTEPTGRHFIILSSLNCLCVSSAYASTCMRTCRCPAAHEHVARG